MNYREKFGMSDYSYNAFSDVLHETLEDGELMNLTALGNCAELLLQAELMVMQPVTGGIPEKAEDFKRELVSNYNYLIANIGNDFKTLPVNHPMMSFLVMYLTKTFNKHEEVK